MSLEINKKTKIYKSTVNINFIGFRRNKKYTNIARIRRKYKKKLHEYKNGNIVLNSLISLKMNYINRRKGVKV